jgi:methyl-accepting chemotaxis protein
MKDLLQTLIDQNADILDVLKEAVTRLDLLEEINEKLNEIKENLEEIKDDINEIKSTASDIKDNVEWTNSTSTAKMILDELEQK